MPEFAIKANGLGKQYRIGAKRYRHTTLGEAVANRLGASLKIASQIFNSGIKSEFLWALQDVTFEIRQGEVLGIIGHNGAGKSTLLKILSRITKPTIGYAEVYGRIGSMLEVGTGFHPELTGRDNIYLSGAILGMAHHEIRRKFDAIVDFSGIERHMDTPVKHYSSGMYLRLGFAVAAHLEPDILLVDEVLAVGDLGFQKKCFDKLQEIIKNGHTVLYVSHNMAAIEGLSKRTLWLDNGLLQGDGSTSEIINAYLAGSSAPMGEKRWDESPTAPHVTEFRLIAMRVKDKNERVWSEINTKDHFVIEIEYELHQTLPYCRVGLVLVSGDGIELFETYDSENPHFGKQRIPGRYISRCVIPGALLKPGQYYVQANAGIFGTKRFITLPNAISFNVIEATTFQSMENNGRRGVISPHIEWTIESPEA